MWIFNATWVQTAVFSPDQTNQTKGENASVQIHFSRSSQSKHVLRVCVILFPQTITKVLLQYCALLAKSFPSYCEKEKIVSTAASPLCYQTTSLWAHLWFGERPSTLKASALSVEWINILVASAHFYNSLNSMSVVLSLFCSFIFLSSSVLFCFVLFCAWHSFALLFLLSWCFLC